MSKKKKNNQVSSQPGGPRVETFAAKKSSILADTAEPTAEKRPVPVLLITLTLVLLYFADLYIVNNGGDIMNKAGAFPAQVYDPYFTIDDVEGANPKDEAGLLMAEGRKVFRAACVACHQENGQGLAGQFPPLAGSEWVLAEGPNRIIRIVLNGVAGPLSVKGAEFNNAMPPWKDGYNDAQLAAVLTYIRNEWGNKAAPVTPDMVKKWRGKDSGRGDPMNAADLQATAEKD